MLSKDVLKSIVVHSGTNNLKEQTRQPQLLKIAYNLQVGNLHEVCGVQFVFVDVEHHNQGRVKVVWPMEHAKSYRVSEGVAPRDAA